ncbi:glycosyltransferase family 2 protein [Mucilaginibacter sp.]|uniref:glycosyltransferase family 2 protein n=1 Tax=Mucilaginibacter sp. TaxID=1882438 RepID=UPI003D11E1C2
MPKVSICIPTYNQIEYLKLTLDSIAIQTFQDYEIIITDDTTGFMVKDLVDQYNFEGRLHYFKNQTPLGSPQNWNKAIEKANGTYIKILHHDDWFKTNESLEKYVNLLADDKIDIAFSSSHVLLDNGENWIHEVSIEELDKLRSCPSSLFFGNKIGSPSAVIFRKDILEIFDKNLKWLVDVEFYIRVINKTKRVNYINEALITTFGAEGRVTDICVNNPTIEIFENFYLFDKIKRLFLFKGINYYFDALKVLSQLCKKYGISTKKEIRAMGYNGKIPPILILRSRLYQ